RPGVAVLLELELRAGQHGAAGGRLAVVLLQLRLVLEGVVLRHRPVHVDEDEPLSLGGGMRGFWGLRVGGRLLGPFWWPVRQQAGERDQAEPGTRGLENLAS